MNTIGKNLKKFREDAEVSQQELAKRLSVTRQTISNWERDISQPDLDSLLLLAEEFHVEAADIIYGQRLRSDFKETKQKRIYVTFVLGALSVLFLVLSIHLLPVLFSQIIEHMEIYSCVKAALLPLFYGTGAAFLLSALSIWIDFRISNRRIRFTLTLTAIILISVYCIFMSAVLIGGQTYTSFNQIPEVGLLFHWFLNNPLIFIFPGAMVFFGFNRKSQPYDLNPLPVQEAEAV